jgi:two-component system, cell cycle sensor histidine kinase and response regulator CckA
MTLWKKRIIQRITDLITSGMNAEYPADTIRRVILANTISLTGIIFMIPLGIVAFAQGNVVLGIVDQIAAFSMLLGLLYLRRSKNHQFACYFGISIAGLLYYFLLVTGGVNNTAHVWYYTFPLASSFLLGSKKGAVATMLLLLFAILFFSLNLDSPYLTTYSKDFIIRFIPSFFVVFVFSFAFEYLREKARERLESKNKELNSTIIELKETHSQLRQIQCELEKRVHERTAELTKTNIDLVNEIKERELAEQDRYRLETQLAHSRKMEAIGTLAGGVAHDLNNILSATVAYPDLILMQLPKDSPIQVPIQRIQNSGKRAAAIVNDLLTLARRGVISTKVTNINEAIKIYFDSPEFEALAEVHSDAKFRMNLEADLPNIVGSPVHLLKTIMNLVNNAAEAMPDGGIVLIATESRYLDTAIGNNNSIVEGDYVILTVKDTGEGISAENMERIFEPFFTKKVMGRSGTGLGMAVVWGTVKDHEGYIDIQSTVGAGTTFTLYLPITRKVIEKEQVTTPIEEIMGKGESVLVVDDIEDQREIASRILKRLGYAVTSVSSGEEAINYLTDNKADLLVLDMIMDPGIDGLDTYKQILMLHPEQKAIIASGFSETERVKEVQRLGAGGYIAKPYTLDKIGEAVKTALQSS